MEREGKSHGSEEQGKKKRNHQMWEISKYKLHQMAYGSYYISMTT